MLRPLLLAFALSLAGCPTPTEPAPAPDRDGDGVADAEDCAPDDAAVYPGAPEGCDGRDTDCDGEPAVDELDEDGDGVAPCAGDCDDTDAALHPGDEDGDGVSPCAGDCDDTDASLHPGDEDGDGVSPCAGDCDDADAARAPGHVESDACDGLDEDCVPDPGEDDPDGDGHLACADDCNEDEATAWLGAPELCDSIDNDCNGVTDDVPHEGQLPSGEVVLEDVAWARLVGEAEWDRAGRWLSSAGDVNGDGYADMLIGTMVDWQESPPGRTSRTHIVYGPVCGEASLALEPEGVTDAVILGLGDSGYLGDVNGDGFDDVRVGYYIWFGPLEGELTASDADIQLNNFGPWDGRNNVLFGPDLNADGVADLVIGDSTGPVRPDPEFGWIFGFGRVAIFFGPITASEYDLDDPDVLLSHWSESPVAAWSGFGVAVPGDLDGDGLEDLVIGSPSSFDTDTGNADHAGMVQIFYGPITADQNLDTDADATIRHTVDDTHFGWDVVGVGDVDGDGVDELAVNGLSVYLVDGNLSGQYDETVASFSYEENVSGRDGMSLAGGTDLDGDGVPDWFVVVRPAQRAGVHIWASSGESVLEPIENSLSGAIAVGDLTGDGRADVLLGLGAESPVAAGTVFVVAGGGSAPE